MQGNIFNWLRPMRAALALFVAFDFVSFPVEAQSPSPAETEIFEQIIPFFTLRDRTASEDIGEMFGDERSGLSAGECRVRELDLGGLASLAEQAPTFLREELLRVDQVSEMDSKVVLDRLQKSAGDRGAAIYVHGYYIGFEKGCRRAALLKYNAQLDGRFLWFSWPSDGALAYYMHDEADLYWSVPDLADTIIELHGRFGEEGVDVVGHSLGARGVVLALYDVANRSPDIRLGEVVLLAPDMDFDIFERILPRISPIAKSITVYVSDGDRPLALSAQLHGYPRLGEAGNDISKLAGVEVIDLSDLPLSSPTGHLYHAYSKEVGADLSQLLNQNLPASARENTKQIEDNLWQLSLQPE